MANLAYLKRRRMPKKKQVAPAAHGMTLRPKRQIVSESLACHPKDVSAFEQDAKKRGFNLHFDSEGRPKFDSFTQRDAYAKTQGFHAIRKRKHPL